MIPALGVRQTMKLASLWRRCRIMLAKASLGCQTRHMSESPIDEDNTGVPGSKDPISRTYRILKNDVLNLAKGRLSIPEEEFFPHFCDVAIVGGGVIGSSIAYWLQQRVNKGLKIVVIERDSTYQKSSTALSVGGIRQQFSLPENIQMSLFGIEFLRDIKKYLSIENVEMPDVKFTPHGYLMLATESGLGTLRENYSVQKDQGARVELLRPDQLKQLFPWLNTDGVALGSYGYGNEGWFDPYSLLMAFRQKAISLGTRFIEADVTGFKFRSIRGVKLVDEGIPRPLEKITKIIVNSEGETKEISPAIIIFAAGPQSGEVGKLAQIGLGPGILRNAIPVEPRKRYVYVVNCPDGPSVDCPLMIDSNGVYFRKEGLGGNYLCGKSPETNEEPDVCNLDVDHSYFENTIWPLLAHRVPCFECAKVTSAWAGYYDYNYFDQNAIIGIHPWFPNLIIATGFSGHGIQQAPAVGRAVMELIIDNGFQAIDLSRFSFSRFINSQPLHEKNII